MAKEEIEVTEMDLIFEAHDRLDAMLELLIEKGVITQKEYEDKLDDIFDRNESEEEE